MRKTILFWYFELMREPWNHLGRTVVGVIAAAGVAFALVAGVAPFALAQDGNVYKVAKVKTDATAKDAVAAKKIALADAEKRALGIVFKRVVAYSDFDRLPEVKPELIDSMLETYSVRSERNSQTQYLATMDFEFNPASVRKLLSGYKVAYSDVQAPRIAVLPVYIEKSAVVSTGQDTWRKAWLELDLSHSVTPVRLARHGPSLTSETIAEMLSGNGEIFASLQQKYKSDALVIALAQVEPEQGRVTIKLYGIDETGPMVLQRFERVYGGDVSAAARRAANISLRILEERWKLTQAALAAGGEAAQRPVILTVEFSGLKQWQQIKGRLSKISGIREMEIGSLSPRTAKVTFRYPGGVEKLNNKLAAQNLVLSNIGGEWVLRSN